MRYLLSRHSVWQLVVDAAIVAASWWLAFSLRFDAKWPHFYVTLFRQTILIVIGIKLVVFVASGFYNRWWRYVSTRDLWGAARGVTAACLVTDAWEGLEMFFEPGNEVLVARDGEEVAAHVRTLDAEMSRRIGLAAYHRVLAEHTYAHRAAQLDAVLAVEAA